MPESPRRIKRYAAQTGYVYEYAAKTSQEGVYVFELSWNRKEWRDVAIMVPIAAVEAWQTAQQRQLKDQHRYAAAKMALFAMLDETDPAGLETRIQVGADRLEELLSSLDV